MCTCDNWFLGWYLDKWHHLKENGNHSEFCNRGPEGAGPAGKECSIDAIDPLLFSYTTSVKPHVSFLNESNLVTWLEPRLRLVEIRQSQQPFLARRSEVFASRLRFLGRCNNYGSEIYRGCGTCRGILTTKFCFESMVIWGRWTYLFYFWP